MVGSEVLAGGGCWALFGGCCNFKSSDSLTICKSDSDFDVVLLSLLGCCSFGFTSSVGNPDSGEFSGCCNAFSVIGWCNDDLGELGSDVGLGVLDGCCNADWAFVGCCNVEFWVSGSWTGLGCGNVELTVLYMKSPILLCFIFLLSGLTSSVFLLGVLRMSSS